MNLHDLQTQSEVLFDVFKGNGGHLGIITLNRPQVLNSLTYSMIIELYSQLKSWADDTSIKAVVITAAKGRAFCAGGDIRLIYEKAKANLDDMDKFFIHEYQLNQFIFDYPKPYIAMLDGITMGGGAGVSVHGSHRIGSENLLFAMPETGIGFFPDVGGTYFLPRLRGVMGYYLGLTGDRLGIVDSVKLGIINAHVEANDFSKLLNAIAQYAFTHEEAYDAVTNVIAKYKVNKDIDHFFENETTIEKCFSKESVEEIFEALKEIDNDFSKRLVKTLQTKSPTSLKVTKRALDEGGLLSFSTCMRQELCLTRHFLRNHDFKEGVRAMIIDKDQNPHWMPSNLHQVTDEIVSQYFIATE